MRPTKKYILTDEGRVFDIKYFPEDKLDMRSLSIADSEGVYLSLYTVEIVDDISSKRRHHYFVGKFVKQSNSLHAIQMAAKKAKLAPHDKHLRKFGEINWKVL